jgi:hypothetical protein
MNESLRLTPSDVNDWCMEYENAAGDHKIPHVILNDKLMTDALLGTIPIKTEHSYSLTSDGDSMPDSPSDGTKIEGEFFFLVSLVSVNDQQHSSADLGEYFRLMRIAETKKSQISC